MIPHCFVTFKGLVEEMEHPMNEMNDINVWYMMVVPFVDRLDIGCLVISGPIDLDDLRLFGECNKRR